MQYPFRATNCCQGNIATQWQPSRRHLGLPKRRMSASPFSMPKPAFQQAAQLPSSLERSSPTRSAPAEWPRDYDSLDHERDIEWQARSTSRKRSSASCVRLRSCWRRARALPKPASGSRSALLTQIVAPHAGGISRTSCPNFIGSRAQRCADAHVSMPTRQHGRSVKKADCFSSSKLAPDEDGPVTADRVHLERTLRQIHSDGNNLLLHLPTSRRGPTTAAA